MAYLNLNSGLNVVSKSAIDKRIYLTKEEMKTAEDDLSMPDKYFAICADDGKIYLFDVNNPVSEEIGKFKPIENTMKLETDGGDLD